MESLNTYEEDGRLLGSSEILSSPNVVEAPSRINQPVPVPSIYQDERGSIHNFQVGGRRLNLLHTRAGVMRSGDIHKDNQHDFVFSGLVEVLTLRNDGTTEKKIYQENQYICIPPYTPHVFHFTRDTVLAEWWDGPFHAWLYKPYRALVEKSFQATKPGRFDHYLVVSQGRDSAIPSTVSHPILWTGIIIGLALSLVFGRRST